jgi:hypothetical protein
MVLAWEVQGCWLPGKVDFALNHPPSAVAVLRS